MLVAVNIAGERFFLIPVDANDRDLVDDSIRGLRVITQQLEISGSDMQRYISVQCTDPGAYDLFDVVGAELLTAIATSPRSAGDAAGYVISRWKRFWGELPRSVMTDESVAGLFGELWFLHLWLSPHSGIDNAVVKWRGPFGARHDFESKALSVEVKTTMSRSNRDHHVNGIDQLATPDCGRLLFFSLVIQREGGATNSIVVLIDAVRGLLQSYPEQASVFDNALAKVGYSDAFRQHYSQLTYRVVSSMLFEVTDAFPQLTRDQLIGGNLMPGVSEVSYKIDLAGFTPSALAERPASADVLCQMKD